MRYLFTTSCSIDIHSSTSMTKVCPAYAHLEGPVVANASRSLMKHFLKSVPSEHIHAGLVRLLIQTHRDVVRLLCRWRVVFVRSTNLGMVFNRWIFNWFSRRTWQIASYQLFSSSSAIYMKFFPSLSLFIHQNWMSFLLSIGIKR